MLARRRDEIGEPVQELKRGELDDAVRSRSCGLAAATGADPVGRPMSRQHVADASDLAGWAADHGFVSSDLPWQCYLLASLSAFMPSNNCRAQSSISCRVISENFFGGFARMSRGFLFLFASSCLVTCAPCIYFLSVIDVPNRNLIARSSKCFGFVAVTAQGMK